MKSQTFQRISTPTAILVGLPDSTAELCSDTLAKGGLRVLRVGHAAAAAERIPIVMARIVVIASTTSKDEIELLQDRAVAVGGVILSVSAAPLATAEDREELIVVLRDATSAALLKALRDGD